MTANAATYHQNLTSEKKSTDIVEKDIRKWVESVVEFKAKLDKQKGDVPLEKRLKKNKKFKTKQKSSIVSSQIEGMKYATAGPIKHVRGKKPVKKNHKHPEEKLQNREETQVLDFFDAVKESYRNLKLPQNWTSGLSNNRVVFNRIKVTTHNAQQKMAVERSLVITKDCNVHVLINGTEVTLPNWEVQRINTIDNIKKAIKDIDSLKFCDGPPKGSRSPQCAGVIDNKLKVCGACKSDTASPPKTVKKKPRVEKKTGGVKEVPKQKSFQK